MDLLLDPQRWKPSTRRPTDACSIGTRSGDLNVFLLSARPDLDDGNLKQTIGPEVLLFEGPFASLRLSGGSFLV